jgi:hypothetical protein
VGVRRIGRSLLGVADSSVLITEPPEGARTRPVDVHETLAGELRQVVLVAGSDDAPPLPLATEATLAAVLAAASSPALPTGGATEATLAAVLARAPALNDDGGSPAHVTNWPATQAVSAAALPLPAGAATQATLAAVDAKLGATLEADVVDRGARLLGHVTVDALPAVSVSNFPSSQAVTGPLTDSQLRATAVPVSGTFWQATQPVSLAVNAPDVTDRAGRLLGHVTVDNPTDTSALATAARQDAQTAHLTTLVGVDYATGADIAGLVTRLDTIATNTADIALDADHLSITADSINLNTDGVEARLDTLNAKDFATQTTLAALKVRGDLLATEATLAAASAKLPTALVGGRLDVNLGASGVTLGVTGPLTDAQLRATAVPVSGTVTMSNPFGGDVTDRAARLLGHVTVDNFPGSQAVTGPLTDAQLRATPVPVDTELSAAGPLATEATQATLLTGAAFTGLIPAGLTVASSGLQVRGLGVPGADASAGGGYFASAPVVYNGATWDRLRSVVASAGNMGATGLLAAVAMQYVGGGQHQPILNYAASGAAADGVSLTGATYTMPGGYVYNGATWDRQRSAEAAQGTAGTGLLGVGNLVYNSGSSTWLRMLSAGSLADANSLGTAIGVGNWLYNGTTWDRMRSAVGAPVGTAAVALRPATSGGLSSFRLLSAATVNLTSVKGSAGQVYGWTITNASAAMKFVKLYNKATAPVISTDAALILHTIAIPAGQVTTLAPDQGIAFSAGIGLTVTGGVGDTDATAVAANDVIVNLLYA